MERYVNHLLEDIRNAHRPAEEVNNDYSQNDEDDNLEKHFAEVEAYIAGDFDRLFSGVCGLVPEQFPPSHKLTKDQLTSICDEFLKMLASWNISADLPHRFPGKYAYIVLVGMLNEKISIMSSGTVHWEFCQYLPEECPFPAEFCTCKDFEYSEDMEE